VSESLSKLLISRSKCSKDYNSVIVGSAMNDLLEIYYCKSLKNRLIFFLNNRVPPRVGIYVGFCILKGMFGWHENSGIAAVFRIEIATVQPNANLLFRNSENNYYSAIPRGRWNSRCSSQLSITIPNKQSKQHFYHSE
jgi:hypothetical protein